MSVRAFILPVSVLACFLLHVGAPVHAQKTTSESINERIDKIRRDLERSRRELEKGEKEILTIKKRKQSVQEEVSLQEKKIRVIEDNIARLEREETRLKSEEGSALQRLGDARRVLALRSEEYRTRLRSMYKRRGISTARIFFNAGSESTLLRGFRMLHALAAADLEVVNSIRSQNRVIETEMNIIHTALNANVALENAKRREQSSLSTVRNKRLELLNEITRDQKNQEEKLKRWKNEIREAEFLMDKLIEEQIALNRKTAPTSLKNYDFASRKGKLPRPVSGRLVSGFGRVVDPQTNTVTINRGVEFETRKGEQVVTIGSGQVVKTQSIRGYGNFVMIHHFPNYYSVYAHLSDILVSEGDIVSEGSVIGLAGSTGLIDDSSSRLLIEVLRGRTPENPIPWMRASGTRAGS